MRRQSAVSGSVCCMRRFSLAQLRRAASENAPGKPQNVIRFRESRRKLRHSGIVFGTCSSAPRCADTRGLASLSSPQMALRGTKASETTITLQ